MLSVITLDELKRLYRNGVLTSSSNFTFMKDTTIEFLKQEGVASIIHLATLRGRDPIDLVDEGEAELMQYLPVTEKDQVLILTKEIQNPILFRSEFLEELEESNMDSLVEMVRLRREMGKYLDEAECVYAVGGPIEIDNIESVMYPESVREQVEEIQKDARAREVLYKGTSLFN